MEILSRVLNRLFGDSESEYPVSYNTINCSYVSVRITTVDDHEHEWSSVPQKHVEVEGMGSRNPVAIHECSYTECPARMHKMRGTGEPIHIES